MAIRGFLPNQGKSRVTAGSAIATCQLLQVVAANTGTIASRAASSSTQSNEPRSPRGCEPVIATGQ